VLCAPPKQILSHIFATFNFQRTVNASTASYKQILAHTFATFNIELKLKIAVGEEIFHLGDIKVHDQPISLQVCPGGGTTAITISYVYGVLIY